MRKAKSSRELDALSFSFKNCKINICFQWPQCAAFVKAINETVIIPGCVQLHFPPVGGGGLLHQHVALLGPLLDRLHGRTIGLHGRNLLLRSPQADPLADTEGTAALQAVQDIQT